MDLGRLLVGGVLGAVAIWIAALNWSVVVRRYIFKRPAGSCIPLLGGVLGAAAIFVLPAPALRDFWWLPLLADWGSLPGFLHAAVVHARAGTR